MKKGTLTTALEKADLSAAAAALRHDVVFHSPILATVEDEVRGHAVVVKALGTAFAYIGPPRNVEEFQNPDGRYIVTFDGVIDGNLIQIAMSPTLSGRFRQLHRQSEGAVLGCKGRYDRTRHCNATRGNIDVAIKVL